LTLILNGTDNSATTPAVTGTDTDTGVYYPASNQVALATNGTQALLIDASGNIGFNTTPSPWWTAQSIRAIQWAGGANIYGQNFAGNNPSINVNSNFYLNSSGAATYVQTADASGYTQNAGNHAFSSAPSGTAGTAVTLTPVLNVGRGTTVALQGASSQSGTGITFPATQSASSNANTLDDYEEGTFTPSCVCTGQTITLGTNIGTYTKIGDIVRAQIAIVVSTVSGAAGGNTTISGFPFANGDTTYTAQGAIGYNDGFANTIGGTWMSSTNMLFRNGTRSQGNDVGGFTAGGYIFITTVYRV